MGMFDVEQAPSKLLSPASLESTKRAVLARGLCDAPSANPAVAVSRAMETTVEKSLRCIGCSKEIRGCSKEIRQFL